MNAGFLAILKVKVMSYFVVSLMNLLKNYLFACKYSSFLGSHEDVVQANI